CGGLLWLRDGWQKEQRHLANLRQHIGSRPDQLEIKAEPLSRWLRDRLPDRIGIYLDRVIDLQVFWNGATDAELKDVRGLTHLRGLMLQGPGITDAGLAELKSLGGMRTLHLHCRQITDAGLSNLHGTQRMEDLMFREGQITNSGLEHLQGMPDLRWLTMCMNQVTREGLLQWMRM